MKRHSNPQGAFSGQPRAAPPLLSAQENMFLTSQNLWATSATSSRGAAGGAMVDPAALLGKHPGGGMNGALDLRSLAVTNGMGQALLQQQLAAALLGGGGGQQSLDSAGEVSLSTASDDLAGLNSGNLMVNKMLMNLNIPTTQFANAMNFQTLSEQNHQVMESGPVNGGYEDDGQSETLEDDESLVQQSFDTSADLVEQQQTQQQASLMSKFKQLREWQQRQQELLMTQQQEQLELLREEQERVQRMVAKQRQMQWGAPTNTKNGYAHTLPDGLMTPQFSSPRPAHRPPPHTYGQQRRDAQPLNTSVLQNGRPVPILPAQNSPRRPLPSDSDLDVESDACSQHSLLEEEGVYPLTDQGSSAPEDLPGNPGPGNQPSHPDHLLHRLHPGGQKQQSGFRNNVDVGFPCVEDRLQELGDSDGEEDCHMDYNHNHDGLDFREGEDYSEQFDTRLNGANSYRTNTQYGDSEESEPEDGYEDNDEECQCAHNGNMEFDEIPVSGLGAKKKTFEELLEEELRKEEERMKQQNQQSSGNASSNKKQFLRKGEGVARYTASGSAERRKPRSRSKRQGQTSGSDMKPARASSAASGSGSSSGGRSSAPVSRPTSAGPRANNTPVTRGLPPKGTSVNRKVFTKPNESSNKQPAQQEKNNPPKVNKENNQKPTLQEKQSVKPKNTAQRQQHGQQSQKPVPRLQLNPTSKPKTIDPCDTPSKYSDTSSLGETSFQARLTARAEMEVVEVEDLEEFELLEQYADDNASFMSNVSAVNRVVKETKTLQRNQTMPPITSIVKRPPVMHTPPPARASRQVQSSSESDDDEDEATSVSSDFDNSSSQTGEGDNQTTPADLSGGEEQDTTLVETTDPAIAQTTTGPSRAESPPRPMQRKVASRDPTLANQQDLGSHAPGPAALTNLLASVQQFSDSDAEPAKNHSVSEDDDETDQSEGPSYDNRGQSEGMVQKQSQKDLEVKSRRRSDETSQQTSQRQPSPSYAEPADEYQTTGDQVNGKPDTDPASQRMAFDDDEAWDTSTVEEPSSSTSSQPNNNPVIRKSILSRNNGSGDSSTERSTPPTSQLVSKLFPKLRQEKPKPKPEPAAEQRLAAASQAEPTEGVQSKLLRDKLAELEQEIERFRTENSTLGKLRKEREEGLTQLKKEMSEFDKQKNEELKRLQEFKTEEMKKLRREKKQFEQYQQTMRAMPNKKEREEIEMLKTQLSELQEEVKRKESRWTSSMARLREKSETLTAENTELKDEIKLLEKQRLQAWQQREHAPKVKEETLRPPAIKKSTHQPTKSPKPESQPCRQASRDSALGLSANLDLDESDLRAADDAPRPSGTSGGSPRTPDVAFTPTPFNPRHSFSPPTNTSLPVETKKPLPRKRATPLSISQVIDKGDEEYEEVSHPDGKVEKMYSNGAREILFTNGTRKQVSAGGQSIIVSFFNGDMKQILPDQRVVYYYADAQTTHTTYPDGLEILQFPNQQIEKHYPDGTKEITFPDQTIKYLFPNGTEESIYNDGTVIRMEKNGQKTVEFPNGQREVHTQHYKRREYPDGTVKTVFPDGKQETRYSSGRVRVKDNDGNVIVDKRI